MLQNMHSVNDLTNAPYLITPGYETLYVCFTTQANYVLYVSFIGLFLCAIKCGNEIDAPLY